MKFFNIRDAREFYERVLRCSGEVHEVRKDGTERDLKSVAKFMIDSEMADHMTDLSQIDLKVEESADAEQLMRYALGMGRERICA